MIEIVIKNILYALFSIKNYNNFLDQSSSFIDNFKNMFSSMN